MNRIFLNSSSIIQWFNLNKRGIDGFKFKKQYACTTILYKEKGGRLRAQILKDKEPLVYLNLPKTGL